MDILKSATDWAKAEVFSSTFFILFGIIFVLASIGFWQLGKTDLARAYIVPMVVAGILILAAGLGIFFTNKSRITSFKEAYSNDAEAFVKSEIVRADKTLKEFRTIVFKVFPIIIVAAALLVMFVSNPTWRAIGVTTIALLVIITIVDSNSNARIENYYKELISVSNG